MNSDLGLLFFLCTVSCNSNCASLSQQFILQFSVLETYEDLSSGFFCWIFLGTFLQALENTYFYFSSTFIYKSKLQFLLPSDAHSFKEVMGCLSATTRSLDIYNHYFPSFKTHTMLLEGTSGYIQRMKLTFFTENKCVINLRNPDCRVVFTMPCCSSQGITIFLGSTRAQKLGLGVKDQLYPWSAFCLYSCTICKKHSYNVQVCLCSPLMLPH